jgi:hypothetical protein
MIVMLAYKNIILCGNMKVMHSLDEYDSVLKHESNAFLI